MQELLVGAALAVFAALLAGGGYLIKTHLERRHADRVALTDRVFNIEAQMRNNGGSSMRDAIDRIERTVTALDSKLDSHLIEASADHARLADHLAAHH